MASKLTPRTEAGSGASSEFIHQRDGTSTKFVHQRMEDSSQFIRQGDEEEDEEAYVRRSGGNQAPIACLHCKEVYLEKKALTKHYRENHAVRRIALL